MNKWLILFLLFPFLCFSQTPERNETRINGGIYITYWGDTAWMQSQPEGFLFYVTDDTINIVAQGSKPMTKLWTYLWLESADTTSGDSVLIWDNGYVNYKYYPYFDTVYPHVHTVCIDSLCDGISDNSSVFLGFNSGINDDRTNNQNTGVGSYSLESVNSGLQNTAVGSYALNSTTGSQNTGLGSTTLASLTTGTVNTAVGYNAMGGSLTGTFNTAVGSAALFSVNGNHNSALGWKTLQGLTTGSYNVGLGNAALLQLQTGSYNTAMGWDAGFSNLTGDSCVFLGAWSGYSETGSHKLYIESTKSTKPLIYGEFDTDSLLFNGTVAIRDVLNSTSDSVLVYDNDAVRKRYLPIDTIIAHLNDTGFWYRSGNYLYPKVLTDSVGIATVTPLFNFHVNGTQGINVVPMGTNDSVLIIESQQIKKHYLPFDSLLWWSDTNIIATQYYVGDMVSDSTYWNRSYGSLYPETLTDSVGVGTSNPLFNFQVVGTAGVSVLPKGTNDTVVITEDGQLKQRYLPFEQLNDTGYWYRTGNYVYPKVLTDSVGVGVTTPNNKFDVNGDVGIRLVTEGTNDSVLIIEDHTVKKRYINFDADTSLWANNGGDTTYLKNTSSYVGIGTTAPDEKLHIAGGNIEIDEEYKFIIHDTTILTRKGTNIALGSELTSVTGDNNLLVGYGSGAAQGSGSDNVLVGGFAGSNQQSVGGNVFVGTYAGNDNIFGQNNIAIGKYAMQYHYAGANNVAIGTQAMQGSSGNYTRVGNTIIGRYAGKSLVNGDDYNTFLGFEAGQNNTGAYNVFIGNEAGENETGSNKLYIENSNSASPLIYGEFDNDWIKINGGLSITSLPVSTADSVLVVEGLRVKKRYLDWIALTDTSLWTLNSNDLYPKSVDYIVGIGTTNPSNELHIYDTSPDLEVEATTDDAYLILNSGTDGVAAEDAGIKFQDNSDNKWYLGKNSDNDFLIYDYTRLGNVFYIEDNGDMSLMETGGKVGIGTTSPDYRMDVWGQLGVRNIQTGNVDSVLVIDDGLVKKMYLPIDTVIANLYDTGFWYREQGHLYPKVVTDSVGIGLSTPSEMLEVDGNIELSNGNAIIQNDSLLIRRYKTNYYVGSDAGSGGSENVFVGFQSGQSNTGSKNTGIGYQANKANTSGIYTFAGGYQAGLSNDTSYNTFIGAWSGRTNTKGYANTYVGFGSGFANQTGDFNTLVGSSAGLGLLNDNNTLIGYEAGSSLTTGNGNTYIGKNAGSVGNATDSSIVIGISAGSGAVVGDKCVFIGTLSGANDDRDEVLYIENSSSTEPLIYGNFAHDTLDFNATVKIRDVAMSTTDTVLIYENEVLKKRYFDFTTANDTSLWRLNGSDIYPKSTGSNIGIGTTASGFKLDVWGNLGIRSAVAGTTDTVLIIDAFEVKTRHIKDIEQDPVWTDDSATYAAKSWVLDQGFLTDGLQWSDTSNQLATDYDLDTLSFLRSETIFAADSANIVHWYDTTSYIATQYDIAGFLAGSQVRSDIHDTADILRAEWRGDIHDSLVANSQGFLQWSDTSNQLATDYDLTLKADIADSSLWAYVGDTTYLKNTSSYVGIGTTAPDEKLHIAGGNINIDAGYEIMQNDSTLIFRKSQNVGIVASLSNLTSGDQNTGLGFEALSNLTSGDRNYGLGFNALHEVTTQNYNVGVGALSGYSCTGNNNTYIGTAAGYTGTSGGNNTFIGYQSGYGTANTFAGNVGIGMRALYKLAASDNNNVAIGKEAGFNTVNSGNVFIGYQAGYNETGGNKLYIENSNSATPLIWGDFSNNYVNINGSLGVGSASPAFNLDVKGTAGIRVLPVGTNDTVLISEGHQIKKRYLNFGELLYWADTSNQLATDYDVSKKVSHFTSNGILTRTAAETYTSRTITGTTGQTEITNGDGVSGNPIIGITDNLVVKQSLTVNNCDTLDCLDIDAGVVTLGNYNNFVWDCQEESCDSIDTHSEIANWTVFYIEFTGNDGGLVIDEGKNIKLQGNFEFDNDDILVLQRRGDIFYEISRSIND